MRTPPCSLPPARVTQSTLALSNKMQQHVCHVITQESDSEPEVFTGPWPCKPLCLAVFNINTLTVQRAQSAPPLSVREVGDTLETQTPAKSHSCQQAFLRKAGLLTLVHRFPNPVPSGSPLPPRIVSLDICHIPVFLPLCSKPGVPKPWTRDR